MTRHQGVVFAVTASEGVLCRPYLHAHQRIGWMHDVGSDVDRVDLLNLQDRGITRVICALEVNSVLSETAGRRQLIGAVKYLAR